MNQVIDPEGEEQYQDPNQDDCSYLFPTKHNSAHDQGHNTLVC